MAMARGMGQPKRSGQKQIQGAVLSGMTAKPAMLGKQKAMPKPSGAPKPAARAQAMMGTAMPAPPPLPGAKKAKPKISKANSY